MVCGGKPEKTLRPQGHSFGPIVDKGHHLVNFGDELSGDLVAHYIREFGLVLEMIIKGPDRYCRFSRDLTYGGAFNASPCENCHSCVHEEGTRSQALRLGCRSFCESPRIAPLNHHDSIISACSTTTYHGADPVGTHCTGSRTEMRN